MEVVVHLILVSNDAGGTVLIKGYDGLCEESYRLEEVIRTYGHEHIQLEITLRCSHRNGGIVAHYLNGDHGHRLALCGVDLAGHDGRAGFVLGNSYLAETGSGRKPADVVRYLHHVARERLYRTVSEYYLILRGECVELVRRCNEGLARYSGDLSGDELVKAPRRI